VLKAISPTDIWILFTNYDIIAYFLNQASCSEHFISIKHRILAIFNIKKKKNQFWQLVCQWTKTRFQELFVILIHLFVLKQIDTRFFLNWTNFNLFLAHLAKGNVNFCHHLASVVCRPLTFHILIFSSETP
jgi:hypothetical protein